MARSLPWLLTSGQGEAKDGERTDDGRSSGDYQARAGVEQSAREERRYGDARREGDSQLQQVAGSRRLITGTAETLRFEESGEDAAHREQCPERCTGHHDEVPQRTHNPTVVVGGDGSAVSLDT